MDTIHGVDVSWLHHSNKERQHRLSAPTSPGLTRDPKPPVSAHGRHPHPPEQEVKADIAPKPAQTAPPQLTEAVASSPTPVTPPSPSRTLKRPTLLSRASSDRNSSGDTPKRRNSWLSSISNKFSQQQQAGQNSVGYAKIPNEKPQTNASAVEDAEPHIPPSPEPGKSSFFSSALRRLSSGTSQSPNMRLGPTEGQCPRRVLNIDKNRERCLLAELDQSKLRRVAFCVDVEIAGGPKYKDEDDDDACEKKKKDKDRKLKEKGEGEALKHPEAQIEEKEKNGLVKVSGEDVGTTEEPNPEGTVIDQDKKDGISRKKEKKKKSEAERKERKEKKRRKAEENGTVPLELTRDDSDDSSDGNTQEAAAAAAPPKDRPTTDPLRIYRRCCQLRESPILKRISEQLSNPSNTLKEQPGLVLNLDLTGSRLQPPDFATLGDWLAVVPVQKIILEDADMTDEAVRCVLSGLLAAKLPEPYIKRHRHSNSVASVVSHKYKHAGGVVEKVVLKNNPRISRDGWKHISLFINMCRSLRAIDVSRIPFPHPHAVHRPNIAGKPKVDEDMAEILSKSLAERLGGDRLEELQLAYCGLNTRDIRKIIDGLTVCGVRRLVLAHNQIDDEALQHVIRYMRSGVCDGIDLGGTDLHDRLDKLVEGLPPNSQLWALCLANCNLTPASLKPLFPALIKLPHLRFLDLSHNQKLFSEQPSALALLRKYVPQLHMLKRMHLADVSMSAAHAIGLAEVLGESHSLAHLNIQENPQLTALVAAKDEESQEEACALYASLMAAARVSESLIAIDVAVPSPDSSEVVQALARQVVAYCLRNMERQTTHETHTDIAAAVTAAIDSHNEAMREVQVPEVLLHLIGHAEGSNDFSHDNDPPAPNEDYIVGGTGLVKALEYCLSQREKDRRRSELVPGSGTQTPRSPGPARDSGIATEHARSMSRSLLDSARKIRIRLQPAITREASTGDDFAYRRLLFLDQILQGMIQRFEAEFPDCRLKHTDTSDSPSLSPATSHISNGSIDANSSFPNSMASSAMFNEFSDEEDPIRPTLRSRHNSDVSLANRALALEEGKMHRIGQKVRRDLLRPQTEDHAHGTTGNEGPEPEHLAQLRSRLEQLDGQELRNAALSGGFNQYMESIGVNMEELRKLKKDSPEDFRKFEEAQRMAMRNSGLKLEDMR